MSINDWIAASYSILIFYIGMSPYMLPMRVSVHHSWMSLPFVDAVALKDFLD